MLKLSNETKEGVLETKTTACDILLDHRLAVKGKDVKKAEHALNRVHVATPRHGSLERPPIIPKSFTDGVKRPEGKKTILELQEEEGGAGVWSFPYQEHYMLDDPAWKYDNPPEIFNGKNVADFYDPDIEKKLDELEKEEDYLQQMEDKEIEMSDEEEQRMMDAWRQVKSSIALKREEHFLKKGRNQWKKLIEKEKMVEGLAEKGVDPEEVEKRGR